MKLSIIIILIAILSISVSYSIDTKERIQINMIERVAFLPIILPAIIPVAILWNGMAEELHRKANNETVILYMKQQKEINDRQYNRRK